MYIKLRSGISTRDGLHELMIEVNITRGIQFHLVGLPDSSIRESRKRIYSALKHNKYHWPGQRITVNLAPASLRKDGASLDLPIALGILAASGQVPADHLEHYLVFGELGLDGSVSPPLNAYNLLRAAGAQGYKGVLLPALHSQLRPPLPEGFHLVEISHLNDAVQFLKEPPSRTTTETAHALSSPADIVGADSHVDCFSEVSGQQGMKAALAIAAAGGHHLLLVGPPGSGKSLLTSNYNGIQPPIHALERPYWLSDASSGSRPLESVERGIKPFYHAKQSLTLSDLFGTSKRPESGLYHQVTGGTLVLDELSNYSSRFLNELLGPMDSHRVQIIASMNPCKCGYLGHPERTCQCSTAQIKNYKGKLSAALWDRFDLYLQVEPEFWSSADSRKAEKTTQDWKSEVARAYALQWERQGCANAALSPSQLSAVVPLSKALEVWLEKEVMRLGLSTRSHHHVLKVARTIADFQASSRVEQGHLERALSLKYKPMP